MASVAVAAVRRRAGRLHRGWATLGILVAWIVLWIPLHGRNTLPLSTMDLKPLHLRLNSLREYVDAHRESSPLFVGFLNVVRAGIDHLGGALQALISQPAAGRPVPLVGWLGVVALAVLAAYAMGNARVALLAGAGFASFGALGYWQESMDTLALTLGAVSLCLLVGVPLGVWIGLSRRAERVATPVLDFMQIMPAIAYLAPLSLFFGIDQAGAIVVTAVYAAPPVVRLTAHAIQGVSEAALEVGTSMGATRWQLLRQVRLPLAKRTIVVGINQTTMCALSMVTIAALISAPGLGQTVLQALEKQDVGTAFTAGLAIVVMAIVLDRVTSAASVRVEDRYRTATARSRRTRRTALAALGAGTLAALYLAYTYVWAAEFPGGSGGGGGRYVADTVNAASSWVQVHLSGLTHGVRDGASYGLLNPLQALLEQSPWYLVAAAVLALAYLVGGPRPALSAAACLALLVASGLWEDSMVTLAATLVATAVVMAFGVVFGVWMGRSDRVDRLLRPTLDAAQVMPAFVYLIPFLGLFGTSRFTAIVAAVVFAVPVAIKVIADGIRGLPPATVEAAVSSGSSAWQVVTKVQVPLARRALALAANQGLVYVLSMVAVGGLVGAGALGYLVVAGFSQTSLYGKGLAAGVAIVLLGILLDRMTQAAARRARNNQKGSTR